MFQLPATAQMIFTFFILFETIWGADMEWHERCREREKTVFEGKTNRSFAPNKNLPKVNGEKKNEKVSHEKFQCVPSLSFEMNLCHIALISHSGEKERERERGRERGRERERKRERERETCCILLRRRFGSIRRIKEEQSEEDGSDFTRGETGRHRPLEHIVHTL